MRLRNLPLHWKIILGMFLGVLFGFLMSNFDSTGKELISNCILILVTIFIHALKFIQIIQNILIHIEINFITF